MIETILDNLDNRALMSIGISNGYGLTDFSGRIALLQIAAQTGTIRRTVS
jgi:hypothetical protein